MIAKFYNNNGDELMAVSMNGSLKLYYQGGRIPYTGPVTVKAEEGCAPCECMGIDPIVRTRQDIYLADYRGGDGYYDHAILKQLLVEDRLPEGRCSTSKAFIICMDAMIIFEWHEQDKWIVDAVIELSKVQLT